MGDPSRPGPFAGPRCRCGGSIRASLGDVVAWSPRQLPAIAELSWSRRGPDSHFPRGAVRHVRPVANLRWSAARSRVDAILRLRSSFVPRRHVRRRGVRCRERRAACSDGEFGCRRATGRLAGGVCGHRLPSARSAGLRHPLPTHAAHSAGSARRSSDERPRGGLTREVGQPVEGSPAQSVLPCRGAAFPQCWNGRSRGRPADAPHKA